MRKYVLLIGAAVLLIGAMAWAQNEYPGYGGTPGSNLSLTQDQQKKLAGLDTKYLADVQSIDKEIAQKDLDLRKLMLAAKPDTKAIEKLENDVVSLQNRRYSVTLDYRNKSRSVLTEQQLQASPYAFMGPGLCPYYGGSGYGYGGMMGGYGGGYGPGYGGGMMRGYGPGYGGGGMMGGWGW